MECQICNKSGRGILTFNKKDREIHICQECIYHRDLYNNITFISSRKYTECPKCKKRFGPSGFVEAMAVHSNKNYQKENYCQCKTAVCEECGKTINRNRGFCTECESMLKKKLINIKALLP